MAIGEGYNFAEIVGDRGPSVEARSLEGAITQRKHKDQG